MERYQHLMTGMVALLLTVSLNSGCDHATDAQATLSLHLDHATAPATATQVRGAGLVGLEPPLDLDEVRISVHAGEHEVASKTFSAQNDTMHLQVPAETALRVSAEVFTGGMLRYSGGADIPAIERGGRRAVSFELLPPAALRAAPAHPLSLAQDGGVLLAWDPVAGATSYNIYWSTQTGAGIGGQKIAGITDNSYHHTELSNGVTYYYVITAVFSQDEGDPTAELSATPAALVDSDGDGLADGDEINVYHTSADNADSDGDTYYDGHEVIAGSDALDATSHPAGSVIPRGTDIFADRQTVIWSLRNAPYIIEGGITVQRGSSLTIEAGVVVKLGQYGAINAYRGSSLDMAGAAPPPQHVIFTSVRDDSINGDSNGDGDASVANAGDWSNVGYTDGSSGKLRHVEMRYGDNGMLAIAGADSAVDVGHLLTTANAGYAVNIHSGAAAVFSDITIDKTRYPLDTHALLISYASPVFSGSNRIDKTGNISSAGINVGGDSAPTLENFTITGGQYGMVLYGARGRYRNISISDVSAAGVYFSTYTTAASAPDEFSNISVSGVANSGPALAMENQVLPAGVIGGLVLGAGVSDRYVAIAGNLIAGNHTLVADPLANGGSVWLLDGILNLLQGATLNVDPGTIVKLNNSAARLSAAAGATLNLNGNSDFPVVFTSFKDDLYGGDSNGDGNASQPQAGNWNQINYAAGSSGDLQWARLRYGRNGALAIDIDAAVTQANVTVEFSN